MNTSKVTSVQGNGTWQSNHGTMYQFEYEFEDGTRLQANHKSAEGAFAVGEEVEYEVTREHPEYGKSGKVRKPNTGGSFDKKGIECGHAVNNGVQIAIAKHGKEVTLENVEAYSKAVYALCKRLEGSAPQEAGNTVKGAENKPQAPISEGGHDQKETDDLPF